MICRSVGSRGLRSAGAAHHHRRQTPAWSACIALLQIEQVFLGTPRGGEEEGEGGLAVAIDWPDPCHPFGPTDSTSHSRFACLIGMGRSCVKPSSTVNSMGSKPSSDISTAAAVPAQIALTRGASEGRHPLPSGSQWKTTFHT